MPRASSCVTVGSGDGRLLLAAAASSTIVPQAACSAPDPFGATRAMRALSVTSVPMLAPSDVPLTHACMRCAAEPC